MDMESFVVLGLILGAAVASVEFGISVAVLEILAGVFAANLVDVPEMPWMEFLGNFGLLGLMFFAGFEMEIPVLRKHWRPSLTIAAASSAAPFVLVWSIALFVLDATMQQALVLAIGLATTSVTLMYAVFRERNLLDREQMQVLLTGAKIVDIAGFLLLQILIEGLHLSSFLMLGIVLASLPVLPRFGQWLFSRYEGEAIELRTRYVLLVLLGLAFFAETVGVHDALVAFLAGIVFSKLIADQGDLEKKLGAIIFGLLAPVFFFRAGQSLDFSLLSPIVVFGILLFWCTVYFSKYYATFFAARRFFSPGFSRFAAITFNFQFSFGVIVGIFALQEGIIGPQLYTVLLSSVLLTSFTAAVALRLREAKRKREKTQERKENHGSDTSSAIH